jgi:acyl-CoA thioester hydrolase
VSAESSAPRFVKLFGVEAQDIDERGHVNNTVYLRWVQDVATAHWQAAATAEQRTAIAWVVLRHEIDYRHPALPGDQILARTWVGPASGLSFERHTELLRAADQQLLARARTVWCPVDALSGRPRRVTGDLRARFSAPDSGEEPAL